MRIFADENIQEPTVLFLRSLGHDVTSVRGVGLKSAADGVVYAHAQQDRRVLLTFNGDFVDLREMTVTEHFGIIRLRVKIQRISYLHPILETAIKQLEGLDLVNTLVTISDRRTRIRKTSA